MGMYAEVIAVGPFKKALVPHLEYPPEVYTSTREGACITVTLFGIVEGSSLSREFASLLGVTDPWDFNQHRLDSSSFDIDGLRQFAGKYPDYRGSVDALVALRDAGFEFHFRPNG